MNRKIKYLVVISSFLITICGGTFAHVNAASKSSGAGFTVSPAQLSFIVQANDPSRTSEVVLSNSYSVPLHLTAELQDIDEQAARLVPSGAVDKQIADAVKMSATDIAIPAKGTYALKLSVDGTGLSDGGHYATLVLTQRSDVGAATGFQSAVSINLFIIKNEHIRTNLQLMDVTFDNPLLSLPKSATITLRNGGNTHIVPRASIIVYDGADIVSKAVVNSNSALLLPGDEQKFSVKFSTLKRFLLPKKLTVRTMYRIDGSDIQLVKAQTLWHIPFVDIIGLVAVLYGAWRWRHRIGGAYKRLNKTMLRHVTKRKHKKSEYHVGENAIPQPKAPPVTLQEESRSESVTVRDDTPPKVASTTSIQRPIIVRMADLAKPAPSPARRISVTVTEEKQTLSKVAPKKRANTAKKRSTKKGISQKSTKAKTTTRAAKKTSTKKSKKPAA